MHEARIIQTMHRNIWHLQKGHNSFTRLSGSPGLSSGAAASSVAYIATLLQVPRCASHFASEASECALHHPDHAQQCTSSDST